MKYCVYLLPLIVYGIISINGIIGAGKEPYEFWKPKTSRNSPRTEWKPIERQLNVEYGPYQTREDEYYSGYYENEEQKNVNENEEFYNENSYNLYKNRDWYVKPKPKTPLQRLLTLLRQGAKGIKRNHFAASERQILPPIAPSAMLAGATTVAVGGVLQQTGVIERVLDAVVEVINPTTTSATTTTTTGTSAPESNPSTCEYSACNPNDVNLSDSPQWKNEVGYWIGEYSFYGSDGDAFTSSSWNYPYDHYKGFVTGNVKANAYRQRNVFMYPPQASAKCAADSSVTGVGTCGTNGNMKVFEADQTATTCSLNPELKGDIEGPFGSLTYTYTQLIGKDNALLYQVWLPKGTLNVQSDRLLQSQLTTITSVTDSSTGESVVHRTRTAQGFNAFTSVGTTSYSSYYREKQVSESEFWTQFNAAKAAYNILDSDTCAWKNSDTGSTISTGLTPGTDACKAHLEETFQL